jgi:NADPH:quinone reductase-like Zn-dependent oxidoreductase
LRVKDQIRSAPASGALLVRMRVRPINPSDLIPIRGAYAFRTQRPFVPGYEGIGVVEEVGPDVASSWLGRRVLPLRGEGTWQTLVKAPAALAIPVPDSITDADAAQLYINPLTAWRIIHGELELRAGDVVVLNAGGSAFAHVFVQLAQEQGIQVVLSTRSPEPLPRLTSLGAMAVVDPADGSRLLDAVREATDGRGASAALDALGGRSGAQLADCLAPGGTFLSYGLLSGEPIALSAAEAAKRQISLRGFWLRRWAHAAEPPVFQNTFAKVIDHVASGRLTLLPPSARFNLTDVAVAVRAAEKPGRTGKVLLEDQARRYP